MTRARPLLLAMLLHMTTQQAPPMVTTCISMTTVLMNCQHLCCLKCLLLTKTLASLSGFTCMETRWGCQAYIVECVMWSSFTVKLPLFFLPLTRMNLFLSGGNSTDKIYWGRRYPCNEEAGRFSWSWVASSTGQLNYLFCIKENHFIVFCGRPLNFVHCAMYLLMFHLL